VNLDDIFDSFVGGTAWGLGVATAAAAAILIGRGGRPLVKNVVKGLIVLGEQARELTAEATEQLQDIYAEASAEIDRTHGQVEDISNHSRAKAGARTRRRRAASA
jgi:hypothetical protein